MISPTNASQDLGRVATYIATNCSATLYNSTAPRIATVTLCIATYDRVLVKQPQQNQSIPTSTVVESKNCADHYSVETSSVEFLLSV